MRIKITFKWGGKKERPMERGLERCKGAWAKAKALVKGLWYRVIGKIPLHPNMSYEAWKKKRVNYYQMLELHRPFNDANFDGNKLKENHTKLATFFQSQAQKPGEEGKHAELILASIHEAHRTLEKTESRMLYNLRIDYRPSWWTTTSVILQIATVVLLVTLTPHRSIFVSVIRNFRKFGVRGSGIIFGTIPPVPSIPA